MFDDVLTPLAVAVATPLPLAWARMASKFARAFTEVVSTPKAAASVMQPTLSARASGTHQTLPSLSAGHLSPEAGTSRITVPEAEIEASKRAAEGTEAEVAEGAEAEPVLPPKPKADPDKTARKLLLTEPPLLEFMISKPAGKPEQRKFPAAYVAACQEAVPAETLRDCGAAGHSPKRFSVQAEKNSWQLTIDDLRSSANRASAATDYAARKIAAAARFINSFPTFNDEDIFLSEKEKLTLKKEQRLSTIQERVQQLRMGTTQALPYDPERNRLDDSLTESSVRDVCDAMYDLLGACGGHGIAKEQDIVVGSVEGALMAWDLTSQIQGAWRVPLTLVTSMAGRQYAYVCVIIHVGARVAALGRSVLEQLSFVPLAKQRVSDVVNRFASEFVLRGHEIKTIHLGLPAECPTPKSEVASRPVIWRYLKLSCPRQEWMSLLASCDLFVAQRRAIRRAVVLSLGSAAIPRGFAMLNTKGGDPRLKAAPPTLKRKQRTRRCVPLPPLGRPDPKRKVNDIGAWVASQEEMRQALYGDMDLFKRTGRNLEDCSSVSSASLDEFVEDRALDQFEPLEAEDLRTAVACGR